MRSQPMDRRKSSCSWVSTPSATTVISSHLAMRITLVTTLLDRSDRPTSRRKPMSSFSVDTGISISIFREE